MRTVCPDCSRTESPDGMRCEFCYTCCQPLYEGYFYTNQQKNPYAEGTVSAGLLQLRVSCMDCVREMEDLGLRP